MSQTKTVGEACGTSGLNIEETIEVGDCSTVLDTVVVGNRNYFVLNTLFNFKSKK